VISDKGGLLRDLLKLGVSFRAKLSEPDLEVYAEMIERRLTDREWRYAYDWFTGDWADPGEAPRFMPTPQELIAIGRQAPRRPAPLTPDQQEYRRRYFAAAAQTRALLADGVVGPLLKDLTTATRPPIETDAEWDHRRRTLLEQADELLHPGKAPDAPRE